MSKFVPTVNIVYKTQLSKEQVIQKLADNLEEPRLRFFRHNQYSKLYVGQMNGNKFKITRTDTGLRSLQLQVTGKVYSKLGGAKIKVSMKFFTFQLFFSTAWFGMITWACFLSIKKIFTNGFSIADLLPFLVLSIGITIFYIVFEMESSENKKKLKKIFEAEIER